MKTDGPGIDGAIEQEVEGFGVVADPLKDLGVLDVEGSGLLFPLKMSQGGHFTE